ncbi:hypothetical protein DVA86_02790 [Streptomyces armeniacus]|uniref:Lipoprotein n=1 Tax=Streptomyces armeniacus TaxID=83291 RepID=A0A345XJB9_9ACTN|nr:hypothetical protein DVA86_02790 [Streptomyces armeniacus]
MRKTTSIAAVAAAVLALTLTGCGEDDDKGSGAPEKSAQAGGSQDGGTESAGPGGESDAPSSTPSPRASDKADKAGEADKADEAGQAREKNQADGGDDAKAPRPSRTSGDGSSGSSGSSGSGGSGGTGGGGGDRGPVNVQGKWYVPIRLDGKLVVMTVNGTSFSITNGGKSCNGTISAGMAVRADCGSVNNGTASVGDGGETLTFNWQNGRPDKFVRTPPSA